MKYFSPIKRLIIPVFLLVIVSCGKDDNLPPQSSNNGNTENITPSPSNIEIPELKGGLMNLFVSHYTYLKNSLTTTYSLEYDCNKRHARWVAFTFYKETSASNTGRSDEWGDDPKIPVQYRSQRSDFSGFNRGHICASADRLYSEEANIQTFYYSNMSPQYGQFNQNIWAKLEEKVRTWGKNNSFRDTLYVTKGGTIDKENQIIKHTSGGLPVPQYYYMALVCRKNNEYKAIAFWLEHTSYSPSSYKFSDYAITIDDLEQKTGINFFHNLPDEIENRIEAEINISDWPELK